MDLRNYSKIQPFTLLIADGIAILNY